LAEIMSSPNLLNYYGIFCHGTAGAARREDARGFHAKRGMIDGLTVGYLVYSLVAYLLTLERLLVLVQVRSGTWSE
jgi:hypothetical protein